MAIDSLRVIKLNMVIAAIVLLAFWRPILSAETSSKAEALNRALAQAKSKVEAEKEIQDQTNDDISYRQKLEARITTEEEELPSELDALIRVMPSRGTESQSGKVGLILSEFEYSYALKAFGKLPVELGIGSQYIGIKNTTNVTLPAHLTTVRFGGNVTFPFFRLDKTYFRVEVMPSFYTDDWNINSTAFRIPINTFAIYQPDETLTLILGVHFFPSGVENSKVSPIAGLIYKPNDKLLFNLVPPKPNILYMMNKKFGVFGEFGMADEQFLVTKDGQKNVVLLYNENRLGTGVLYKFNNFAETTFSVGGTFNGYLKYKESLGKVVIKNGLYTEFRTELYW
jgi:hypothetical protein